MNAQSPSQEPSEDRSPWSRPSVLISGAFLLTLALLGIIVSITDGGPNGGRRGSTTTPAARPPAPSALPSTRSCALAPGSQIVPSSSPPSAQWGTVGSMQVPQSPAVYGPAHISGIWSTCFAHSPSGALLAAMNFYAEGTAASPSAVMAHLAVNVTPADTTGGQLDSSGPIQIAGYRYDSYTRLQAQVAVVIRGPQGKLAAIVTPMVWTGSDWRYRAPANGVPSAEVLGDLTGYIPWSAF